MKFEELKRELNKVNECIGALLRKTNSNNIFNEINENVKYDEDLNKDMYENEICMILTTLEIVKEKIDYLNKEVKNVGKLTRNKNNRYELNNIELHCGDEIEALIYDNNLDKKYWMCSRIECENDYYLVGYKDMKLDNLEVRIR